VIVDGVFNHTGRGFFAFDDIVKKQENSPYTGWYVIQEFDDPETEDDELKYQCWWGVDTLPEFANNEDGSDLHRGPKKYIFDATRRWMDPNRDGDPADGIDGWRLDVANEVPDQFWVDWNRLVRELNPEAYTVSEIWEGAADYLRRCGFSASMNYHAFAFVAKGFLLDGRAGATSFVSDVELRRVEHPWRVQLGMQNLFDSHDTERIASMIVNAPRNRTYVRPERSDYDIQERASPRHWDEYLVHKPNSDQRRIQRLATLFQMSYIGAPMIYYGTESGMWGGDDPCDRKPMVWDDLDYDDESTHPFGKQRSVDSVAFDRELFDFYRAMVGMRKQSPALRRGSILAMTPFESAQSVAMLRKFDNAWALVVVNRSEESQTLRLSAVDFLAPPATARRFATDDQHSPTITVSDPTHISVTLPRLSAACWTWAVE
jgi:glycosidase